MDNGKSSTATLRIFSETLSSSQITQLLGQLPTRFFKRGDPVSKSGRSNSVRQYNKWSLDSAIPRTEPLDAHIEEILAFVEDKAQVIEELRGSCEIDIFCGFSSKNGQGGFVLSPELLARLAKARLHIIFDLYPPENDISSE